MKKLKLSISIILAVLFFSSFSLAQDTSLTVTADGNVGIGTSNPQQKLHVNGLARFELNGGEINISTPGGNPGIIAFDQNGNRRDIVFSGYGLRLQTSSSSSAPAVDNGITIKESGNVGIGINFPTEKLDVAGNAHIAGKITSGDSKVSLPIAYGVINADGSVQSATSNVGCSWNANSMRYEISISGETYHLLDYVTTVEPIGEDPVMTSTNSVSGKLLVIVFNSSGSKTQNLFHFVVYKP